MLALGVTLLVSVAAQPPAIAHEPLASTYDQASCDAADGGECADEALLDLMPAPAAILDCENPFIADMIGSCDLPQPVIPSLHLPTLRNAGSGFSVATRSGSTEHLSVVTAPTSIDAALTFTHVTLAPAPFITTDFALASTSVQDAPRPRLDRPPRA
jgi:hypothetical protein